MRAALFCFFFTTLFHFMVNISIALTQLVCVRYQIQDTDLFHLGIKLLQMLHNVLAEKSASTCQSKHQLLNKLCDITPRCTIFSNCDCCCYHFFFIIFLFYVFFTYCIERAQLNIFMYMVFNYQQKLQLPEDIQLLCMCCFYL